MTLSSLNQARTPKPVAWNGVGEVSPYALVTAALLAAFVAGLWLLHHPYEGIIHDARLYVGHGLAAADPQGVGQDIMFRNDGQFGLTVFSVLLSAVIAVTGVSLGAKLVSLAGLLMWIGAMAALAWAMAEGRLRWVILAFVVVLPTGYGGFGVFNYAEPFATPRIFAEAGVLLAFALMCRARMAWALLPPGAALALHPIMALPGLGVWAWFVFADPKTRVFPPAVGLACAGLGVTLLLVAAALQVPLAERLFIGIDPDFRAVLTTRVSGLFLSLWPLADWSHLVVQGATLAVAAGIVAGRVRTLFVGALVVGLGGVAVSLLLGDALNVLLAVQAQLWRSVWIVAVLAASALAICAVALWREGGGSRVTLGFLVVAWLGAGQPMVGMVAVLGALAFAFVPALGRLKFQHELIVALWSFVAVYATLRFGLSLYAMGLVLSDRPDGGANIVQLLGQFGVFSIPVCALGVVWALGKREGRVPLPIAASLAVVAVALGAVFWDARTPRVRAADTALGDPALKAILASRNGEVLWLDGRFETWSFTGRSNWVSAMQGASGLFSRPLAMAWDKRARRLIDLGLTDDKLREVFAAKNRRSLAAAHLSNLTDAKVERLCGSADAPAWLIAPSWAVADSELSARWSPTYWKAPGQVATFEWTGSTVEWQTTKDYAVIPCAS